MYTKMYTIILNQFEAFPVDLRITLLDKSDSVHGARQIKVELGDKLKDGSINYSVVNGTILNVRVEYSSVIKITEAVLYSDITCTKPHSLTTEEVNFLLQDECFINTDIKTKHSLDEDQHMKTEKTLELYIKKLSVKEKIQRVLQFLDPYNF